MKVSINNYLSGSAQPQLPIKDIVQIPILIPALGVINLFTEKIQFIQNDIDLHNKSTRMVDRLLNVVLSKMAKA
jgi:type I restriction enzyme S subunit